MCVRQKESSTSSTRWNARSRRSLLQCTLTPPIREEESEARHTVLNPPRPTTLDEREPACGSVHSRPCPLTCRAAVLCLCLVHGTHRLSLSPKTVLCSTSPSALGVRIHLLHLLQYSNENLL